MTSKRVNRFAVEEDYGYKMEKAFLVAEVISKFVEPQFCGTKSKHFCRKRTYKKYKKVFQKIYDYLESRRGNFTNSMESLIKDYLVSIYTRYGFYDRTPFVTQLSPSEKNIEGFDIWIHRQEEFFGESYFTKASVDYEAIRSRVASHFNTTTFGEGSIDDKVPIQILEI